jgi:hypothetical protein
MLCGPSCPHSIPARSLRPRTLLGSWCDTSRCNPPDADRPDGACPIHLSHSSEGTIRRPSERFSPVDVLCASVAVPLKPYDDVRPTEAEVLSYTKEGQRVKAARSGFLIDPGCLNLQSVSQLLRSQNLTGVKSIRPAHATLHSLSGPNDAPLIHAERNRLTNSPEPIRKRPATSSACFASPASSRCT